MPRGFEPVKIGVVGLGHFGLVHARTLAGICEADLVAVVDQRQDALDSCVAELSGVTPFTDIEDAIRDAPAEAWIVASSTPSHVPVATQILQAGKPVLVEKPIALSIAEAQSLEPLVKADSSNLMMGHVALFNSEYRQLVSETDDRSPIMHVSAVRHRPYKLLELFPGESPFHLTMVHDLYCVLGLMRRREPIRFSAQTHRTGEGQCNLALAQLQWEDGALASFSAGFVVPPGMEGDGYDQMDVFGDGWSARLNTNPRPIQLWDERARHPLALEISDATDMPTGMLAEQLRCFCRVVRNESEVPMGAAYQDALQIMRWIERLEAAAAEHENE